MDIEILRMIERIIIAAGGVLSIILGYRLFRIASVASVSGGSFRSAAFSMTLTKVGPGIFFALFGAYVLSTGLTAKIQTTPSSPPLYSVLSLVSLLQAEIHNLPDGDEKATLTDITQRIVSAAQASLPPPASPVASSGSFSGGRRP